MEKLAPSTPKDAAGFALIERHANYGTALALGAVYEEMETKEELGRR
jgi:hypothetical protein